jgi:hypothetical protein
MDRAVPSRSGKGPLIQLNLVRFNHIAVDVVATKNHSSIHVLYVASRDGLVRKYSVLPSTQEGCLVEIVDPFARFSNPADRQIKTMQFLKVQVCVALVKLTFRLGDLSLLYLMLFLPLYWTERAVHWNEKRGDPTGQSTMQAIRQQDAVSRFRGSLRRMAVATGRVFASARQQSARLLLGAANPHHLPHTQHSR